MSKTSNHQKLVVLKVWLSDFKKKVKPKKAKFIIDEED